MDTAEKEKVPSGQRLQKLRRNWNHPNEGEYVSIKEFLSMGMGGMGIEMLREVTRLLEFTGTAFVTGMIYNIFLKDIYIINIIGVVLSYLLIPLNAMIIDNLGVLPKRFMRTLHLGTVLLLLLSALLWTLPSAQFDHILKDIYKHVALRIICTLVFVYASIYVLKLFGKKYGKFKPFVVFFGIPTFLFSVAMVYLPVQDMRYSTKLLWVHLLTTLIVSFRDSYTGGIVNLQGLMSPNSQERTRIQSIAPIITTSLRALFSIVFPMMANVTGGQTNIATYRWVVPVIGALGLLEGLLVIRAKERVIRPPDEKPKVELRKSIKQILTNKYIWIKNISNMFIVFSGVNRGILSWMLLYGTRMEFFMGAMIAITGIPSTPGNLITPAMSRRFSKRQIMLMMRSLEMLVTICFLFIPYIRNDTLLVGYMILLGTLHTFSTTPCDVIGNTINYDIWDYEQWRSGERLEGSMSLFGYLTDRLGMILGYITPYLLKTVGLVNDWDILFDPVIRNRIFMMHSMIAIAGAALVIVPYLFYDLTPEKLQRIFDDLQQRAAGQPHTAAPQYAVAENQGSEK